MFKSLINSVQNCNANIILQPAPNTSLKRTGVN